MTITATKPKQKGRTPTIRPQILTWVDAHPNTEFTLKDLVPPGLKAVSSGYYKILKDLVTQGIITRLDAKTYHTNPGAATNYTHPSDKREGHNGTGSNDDAPRKTYKRRRHLPDTIEFEVIAETEDRIILRYGQTGDFFSARRVEL